MKATDIPVIDLPSHGSPLSRPPRHTPFALFLFDEVRWDHVYGPEEHAQLQELFGAPLRLRTRQSVSDAELAEVKFIFSSWGMERCDEAFLRRAPKLQAIFYAAGSVRYFVTDPLWERRIRISSCAKAMGTTVAEFALGQILLSLKSTWQHHAQLRRDQAWTIQKFSGLYKSTVGLISLGTVALSLVKLLKAFQLSIIAYDPLVSQEKAKSLGVDLCSLDEVFSRADVVSIHTPWMPETEGLIRGYHIEKMRHNTTLINMSRGAIVAENELIEVLIRRPDLFALLDVTHPEPPKPDSPLFALPNVLMTPHMAGACWGECRRLGQMAIEEYRRFLRGDALEGEVTREMMPYIA